MKTANAQTRYAFACEIHTYPWRVVVQRDNLRYNYPHAFMPYLNDKINRYSLSLAAIVLLLLGAYFWIDLAQIEPVVFCGRSFRAKKVMMDKVNIIETIATISTEKGEPYSPCSSLRNLKDNAVLDVQLRSCRLAVDRTYCLNIESEFLIIFPQRRKIYLPSPHEFIYFGSY